MNSALLEDRAVIVVSGDEAGAFLDRILTNDVPSAPSKPSNYAALLTPQGKMLADILLAKGTIKSSGYPYLDGYMLIVPRILALDVTKKLLLFKLRAKVDIFNHAETSESHERPGVAVVWDETTVEWSNAIEYSEVTFDDPRVAMAGRFEIEADDALKSTCSTDPNDLAAYHAHRIALGIPYGGLDFAYGDAFPHEVNLDRLRGIDFKKGCYVGQEIVSRTEHRGTARTRIMKIAYAGGIGPEAGTPVTAGEKSIGSTGYSVAGQGLATIRLDKLADALAAGERIHAGGIDAVISAPPYAPDFMPDTNA